MFTICLHCRPTRMTGLTALDFSRTHGLTESVDLDITDAQVSYPVGEGFARAYFGPHEKSKAVAVPARLLCKGDLVNKDAESGGYCHLNPDMSQERAEALFVACMFHNAKNQ